MRIALFDYGVGNLHSLGKALEAGGAEVLVTRDWDEALAADGLVLPGVGAFSAAVDALPADRAPIRRALEAGLPCLGICLGMQILFEASDEGPGEGIGVVAGHVRRLDARIVPQMGWNVVETGDDPLFEGIEDLTAYYANSYVCEPGTPTTPSVGPPTTGTASPRRCDASGPGAPSSTPKRVHTRADGSSRTSWPRSRRPERARRWCRDRDPRRGPARRPLRPTRGGAARTGACVSPGPPGRSPELE